MQPIVIRYFDTIISAIIVFLLSKKGLIKRRYLMLVGYAGFYIFDQNAHT